MEAPRGTADTRGEPCAVDADCRERDCNLSTYLCGRAGNGFRCTGHEWCVSDYCEGCAGDNCEGICRPPNDVRVEGPSEPIASQPTGASCNGDTQCESGVCSFASYVCGPSKSGQPCARDEECMEGLCGSQSVCGPQPDFARCDPSACVDKVCPECSSGFCRWSNRACTAGDALEPCENDADCRSGYVCNTETDGEQRCAMSGTGMKGDICTKSLDCASNTCQKFIWESVSHCGPRAYNGTQCSDDTDCLSSYCHPAQKKCMTRAGEQCGVDGSCSGGCKFCESGACHVRSEACGAPFGACDSSFCN